MVTFKEIPIASYFYWDPISWDSTISKAMAEAWLGTAELMVMRLPTTLATTCISIPNQEAVDKMD